MRRRCTFALAALLLAGTRLAGAATVDVHLGGPQATSFQPQTVSIDAGDTVRWINDGGLHDLTADDQSFGTSASSSWTFSHTFSAPGTFGYHCSIHGVAGGGMFGTVLVGGAAAQPGTLRFSQSSYLAAEAAGSAEITVQRVDGDDGAVSVQYTALAGTASAGSDFTATGGTLTWAAGDAASKSFAVAVIADSTPERSETVQLALEGPTGGAALDPAHDTATLTILDDDVPPGNPPAAPSGLQATAQSTTEVALSWTDNSNNEGSFRVERRTVDGSFEQVLTVGANTTSAVVPGLAPSTFYLFRVRAATAGGALSAYSGEASAATAGLVAPCVAGAQTLCLNDGRFRTEVAWRIAGGGGHGQAVPLPSAPDSGLFYFFGAANLEMLIKVLDACFPPFDRYWVFYAATTNVEFGVTVTDTRTGTVRAYFNPLDRTAPPVQDVAAFATCP